MELTAKNKAHIDSLSYDQLLREWRFAPVGTPWFQGEAGDYWSKRMTEKREAGSNYVQASKNIGWDR
jgi:hypothetical protein